MNVSVGLWVFSSCNNPFYTQCYSWWRVKTPQWPRLLLPRKCTSHRTYYYVSTHSFFKIGPLSAKFQLRVKTVKRWKLKRVLSSCAAVELLSRRGCDARFVCEGTMWMRHFETDVTPKTVWMSMRQMSSVTGRREPALHLFSGILKLYKAFLLKAVGKADPVCS